jgi:SAM-dependent methyltransferase
MSKIDNLSEYLTKEYNADFAGWDFSYIRDRRKEDALPWDYKRMVERYILKKGTLLDIDTGGGEFLNKLSGLPKKIFATEGYAPNIPLAKKNLANRNITVKAIERGGKIPFDDEFFDVVICRHGSYNIGELKRVLKKGGVFVTQQVGGLNGANINMSLGARNMKDSDWCLVKNIKMFQDIGMEVLDSSEYVGKMRFYDIGALAYYLKCVPWQVEDFSVAKYYVELKIINDLIEKNGYVDFLLHRFCLIVKKL